MNAQTLISLSLYTEAPQMAIKQEIRSWYNRNLPLGRQETQDHGQ